MHLHDLGFDQWFETNAPDMRRDNCIFARVTAVDRGTCLIRHESGEIPAEPSGRLIHHAQDHSGLPCVGDWVTAQPHGDGSAAIIHAVFPRRTLLRRRPPGEASGHQMIAANIDTALLVQSCHFDFNPNRLERYAAMAADGGVEAVALLTKTDLAAPGEVERKLALAGSITRGRAVALSAVDGSGLDELRGLLAPGRTCCLLGSSGVGKTTLLNRLAGREAFETRSVSATGEGTHTTTRRQLAVLEGGALVIDTPGMRELGLAAQGHGLDAGFDDIAGLAAQCRFADCTHRSEPGCAVRAAMERGEVRGERFANYLKLRKETEFHELASHERRKRDKAFRRMVKSVRKR